MKRLFTALFFCVAISTVFGKEIDLNKTYFSSIINSAEWKKLKSTKERIEALQLPQDTIQNLSTEELLSICLDFPYNIDVLLCSENNKNLSKLFDKFNGYSELFNRKDLEIALPLFQSRLSAFIDSVDNESKKKLEFKRTILNLIDTSYSQTVSNNIISDKKSGLRRLPPEKASDYSPAVIYTPLYSQVPNSYVFTGTDYETLGWLDRDVLTTGLDEMYNHAQLLGDPSYRYNSHGYAWNPDNLVWIEDSGISTYWDDESYEETTEDQAEIVYYVEGHHSAKRLNSTWYVSKWEDGLLVKHHPDALPLDYHPELTRKYYKKRQKNFSISGTSNLCGNEIYSVENLPVACDVNWKFKESNYLTAMLQQDYPVTGQCYFDNSAHDYINHILVATISKNGFLIDSVSKHINAYIPFYGSYSQNAGNYNKYKFQSFSDKTIPEDGMITVNPECTITIWCPKFRGTQVSSSNSQIRVGKTNEETVTFKVPFKLNNIIFRINAISEEGCDNFLMEVAVTNSIITRRIKQY